MRGHVEHTRAQVGRTARPIDTITTGENSRFPATLAAYDAVHDWITANGYNIADSPCEIWHNEDTIEIAWPFQEGE